MRLIKSNDGTLHIIKPSSSLLINRIYFNVKPHKRFSLDDNIKYGDAKFNRINYIKHRSLYFFFRAKPVTTTTLNPNRILTCPMTTESPLNKKTTTTNSSINVTESTTAQQNSLNENVN